MKSRSFFLALGTTVLTLLVVSMVGFYWLVSQSPLKLLQGGKLASPAAAIFVPKQAPAMVSLLVNPEKLQALRLAIAAPGDRHRARVELSQFKQSLFAGRGIRYETDIKPWLGDEITLAVTTPDIDRDSSNGRQPGYLLALSTEDPDQAREFLQLFWQKRAIGGTDLVFEQYAGVKLIYGSEATAEQLREVNANLKSKTPERGPLGNGLSSALVGDRFVLFANSPKVLRDALNNVQASELSLSSSSTYQKALDRLPSRQMGLAFVNLPQLGRWLGNAELAGSGDDPNRQFESLVAGLELERQGVLAETALLPPAGQNLPISKPVLSNPTDALQFVPAATPFAASGKNLAQLWTQLSSGLANYGILSQLLNQPIAVLEREWGVKFAEDLVSWVDREFAVGLVPPSNGDSPEWVFATERSPSTLAALENLDAIAQKQGLSIGPVELGDQQTFAWTRLSTASNRKKKEGTLLKAEVRGVHTPVNSYELFTSSVEAMGQVLNLNQKSLLKTPDFQQAIAPLARNNDGYLYLDWRSLKQPLERKVPVLKLAELAGKPFFDHLRSLTLTSYGSDGKVLRGAVFIQLKDH